MGLCIGIREDQIFEAVEILGTDKYVYKCLFDSSENEVITGIEGIELMNDCLIYSGTINQMRAMRNKVKGEDMDSGADNISDLIFLEKRQMAIVNDYKVHPHLVLIFPQTIYDTSANRNKLPITHNVDIRNALVESLLRKLKQLEGIPTTTLELYKSGFTTEDETNAFEIKQEEIIKEMQLDYKKKLLMHFEESYKFRLITYYTKLRDYGLDDIMRKLRDLNVLDSRFDGECYIYEEEARRLLARRLCTMSFKNDIELLISKGILNKDRIKYEI